MILISIKFFFVKASLWKLDFFFNLDYVFRNLRNIQETIGHLFHIIYKYTWENIRQGVPVPVYKLGMKYRKKSKH